MAFFRPGVDWVAHQWLPTFYIPALVTLPLAVAPLSGWLPSCPGVNHFASGMDCRATLDLLWNNAGHHRMPVHPMS